MATVLPALYIEQFVQPPMSDRVKAVNNVLKICSVHRSGTTKLLNVLYDRRVGETGGHRVPAIENCRKKRQALEHQ